MNESVSKGDTNLDDTNLVISRDEKKSEAIRRLKKLKVQSEIIRQFEEEDVVNIIIGAPLSGHGGCYRATPNDLKNIRNFEQEHNALVYTVIRSYSNYGTIDNYLFVSNYKEDWEIDMTDLDNQEAVAYSYNRSYPDFSEIGYIGIINTDVTGLIRLW